MALSNYADEMTAKIGHAIKDALGSSSAEFEGKMSAIRTLKGKILESAQSAFQQKTFLKFDRQYFGPLHYSPRNSMLIPQFRSSRSH